MSPGLQSYQKSGGAWLAGLSFCLVYLASLLAGAGPWTTLERSLLGAAAGFAAGRWLVMPLMDVLLEALAEAERRRQAQIQRQDREDA